MRTDIKETLFIKVIVLIASTNKGLFSLYRYSTAEKQKKPHAAAPQDKKLLMSDP